MIKTIGNWYYVDHQTREPRYQHLDVWRGKRRTHRARPPSNTTAIAAETERKIGLSPVHEPAMAVDPPCPH